MRMAVAKNGADEPEIVQNGARASLIDSVEVVVEAFLGGARLTVAQVKALKPDSLIDLDAALGAAVELRLNGTTIGRGELVAVGDRFGVRITEVGK